MLGNLLETSWDEEKRNNPKNPKLLNAIFKVFGKECFWIGIGYLLKECIIRYAFSYHKRILWFMCMHLHINLCKIILSLRILFPLTMSWLISSFEEYKHQIDHWHYGFGFIIFACLQVLTEHPLLFSSLNMGMRIRVAVSSIIYRKSLKIMKTTDSNSSLAKTVNLLSNDVIRLDLACLYLHSIWFAPIQFIIIISIAAYLMGLSTIVGAVLFLLFMMLQSKLSIFTCSTSAGQQVMRVVVLVLLLLVDTKFQKLA